MPCCPLHGEIDLLLTFLTNDSHARFTCLQCSHRQCSVMPVSMVSGLVGRVTTCLLPRCPSQQTAVATHMLAGEHAQELLICQSELLPAELHLGCCRPCHMPINLGLPQQRSSSESTEPALLAVLRWRCPPYATLHTLQCLFCVQCVFGHEAPCGSCPIRAKQACSPVGLLQALPAWQDAQQRQQPASTSGRPSLEAPHGCSSGLLGSHWSWHSQQTLPSVCRGFAAVSAHTSMSCRLENPPG